MKVGFWSTSEDDFRAMLAKEDVNIEDLNREAFDILLNQSLCDQSLSGGDPWRYGLEFHTLRVIKEMKKLNIITHCDAEAIERLKLRNPVPPKMPESSNMAEEDESPEDKQCSNLEERWAEITGFDQWDDPLVYNLWLKSIATLQLRIDEAHRLGFPDYREDEDGTVHFGDRIRIPDYNSPSLAGNNPKKHGAGKSGLDTGKEPTIEEMMEYINAPKNVKRKTKKVSEAYFTPLTSDERAQNLRIIGWLTLFIAALTVCCAVLYANDLLSPRATSIFPIAAVVAMQRIATKYHSRFSRRFNLARLATCAALLFSSAAYFVIKGIYLALCLVTGSIATTPFALLMMGLFLVLKVVCSVLISKTTDSRRGVIIGWVQSLAITMFLASFIFGAMGQ